MNKILKRIMRFFKRNKKNPYADALYSIWIPQPKFPKPPIPNNKTYEEKKYGKIKSLIDYKSRNISDLDIHKGKVYDVVDEGENGIKYIEVDKFGTVAYLKDGEYEEYQEVSRITSGKIVGTCITTVLDKCIHGNSKEHRCRLKNKSCLHCSRYEEASKC